MVHSMINHEHQQLWEQAIAKADSTGKGVLVSIVTDIDHIDPLVFFSLDVSSFAGSRFFWADPDRSTTFVGLGEALVLEAGDASGRYRQIDRQWRDMAKEAVVSEDAPGGTGPMMFGGFSFDSAKPPTALWRRFPHTRFVVPRYMLTVDGNKSYLTVNRLVSSREDRLEDIAASMLSERHNATFPRQREMRIYKEEIDPNGWMRSVEEAAASVRKGELDKVVLARRLRLFAEGPFAVTDALERLLREQENTYVFAFMHGEDCFMGATPERLVKSSGKRFFSACLAGSIARGETRGKDEELGRKLLRDPKNLHEHAIVTRMIKEAMSEVCAEVSIPSAPELRKLKDIQHLYTPVVGRAKDGVTIMQVVEALHPTPALGGMPRQEAVKVIRRVEPLDRGWYASPIGWINRQMDGEFAAAIRSALIRGKEASLFAGCGIVGDSDPVSEYKETELKFMPMLSALQALDAEA